MANEAIINIRVDESIKNKASKILAESGLTTSTAIRLFLLKVIKDKAFPAELLIPNTMTERAMKAALAGKTVKAKNLEDLFKKLNA
ncbi:MAG: type II toxin-antitoxin system RelB/DinJ family antitoxin, partial [Actinobacteria bacterium]|jgi:DNA-damage-inducible protein J|nr:type II toxin-antitoxin system RelB/DinJ family antitoxin [Actinomycetota bacterium]